MRSEVNVLGVDSRYPAAQFVSAVQTRLVVCVFGVDSNCVSKLQKVSGVKMRSLVLVLSVERYCLLYSPCVSAVQTRLRCVPSSVDSHSVL